MNTDYTKGLPAGQYNTKATIELTQHGSNDVEFITFFSEGDEHRYLIKHGMELHLQKMFCVAPQPFKHNPTAYIVEEDRNRSIEYIVSVVCSA